jgi:Cytochrome c oxidase subunit IV
MTAKGQRRPGKANDRERDSDPAAPGDHQRLDGATDVAGGLSSEAKLFGRMAIFGIGVGSVYWFLTYETAGSVMLTTFGVASGIAAIAIFVGSRRQPPVAHPAADGPVGATLEGPSEPVPEPGWAPLGIAIGLGGVALAGPFGPWLAIAGLFLALRSAKAWLDATVRETDAARGRARPRHDHLDD